jgi:hypothetical protein
MSLRYDPGISAEDPNPTAAMLGLRFVFGGITSTRLEVDGAIRTLSRYRGCGTVRREPPIPRTSQR